MWFLKLLIVLLLCAIAFLIARTMQADEQLGRRARPIIENSGVPSEESALESSRNQPGTAVATSRREPFVSSTGRDDDESAALECREGVQLLDSEVQALIARCENEIDSLRDHVRTCILQATDTTGFRMQIEAELALASKEVVLEQLKKGEFFVEDAGHGYTAPGGGRATTFYGVKSSGYGLVKVVVPIVENSQTVNLRKALHVVRHDEGLEAAANFNTLPEPQRIHLIEQHRNAMSRIRELETKTLQAAQNTDTAELLKIAREEAEQRKLLLHEALEFSGSRAFASGTRR